MSAFRFSESDQVHRISLVQIDENVEGLALETGKKPCLLVLSKENTLSLMQILSSVSVSRGWLN